MFEEQIKLKADSPYSQLAKESISSALVSVMYESSIGSRIPICLCSLFRSGKSMFYQQVNPNDIVSLEPTGHRMTTTNC